MVTIARAISMLVGTALSTSVWLQTRSWWKTALVAAACALLAFARKIWVELESQWAKRVAGFGDRIITGWLARYHRRYARHLYFTHRTFDIKGFSTQGKFALELERIYVELSMDPAVAAAIPQNPIRVREKRGASSARDIFAWLRAGSANWANFAIIGPPGSGKTTLLKHLTLACAAGEGPFKLTPVLLFLREHATAIGANPRIRLAELIESTLSALPPPPGWFQRLMEKGRCVIMFDGLDEIADPQLRRKVVTWVERQAEAFGANRFLVASRPNGYRDNPLPGFSVLHVLPFSIQQVERFVRNWYLANELMSHQKDDTGVRMDAERGAQDLLTRLRRAPALQDLAVNPLLLTLIATVHRFRSELPGRRVELFAEICDVFLGKRQQARGLDLDLTPAQKIRVLRVLAYKLMRLETREIPAIAACQVIEETLKLVAPCTEPHAFLGQVEDASGLLVERESGLYGFAHLTFQEYLASLHIREERLVGELAQRARETWWHEVARLYAAQADASSIVKECLAADPPPIASLVLATECADEALELSGDLRERLRRITDDAVESEMPDRRRWAAEHILAQRNRKMIRIDDEVWLDPSPITHAEYQLFIDEMRALGQSRKPDHWEGLQFPRGTGRMPVVGIRKDDAKAFCMWLGERESRRWTYSLPRRSNLDVNGGDHTWDSLRFFTADEPDEIPMLAADDILGCVDEDAAIVTRSEAGPQVDRGKRRLIWYAASVDIDFDSQPVAVDLALFRRLSGTHGTNVAGAVCKAIVYASQRRLPGFLIGTPGTPALKISDCDHLAQIMVRARTLDLRQSRDLVSELMVHRALVHHRGLAQQRYLVILNWLCISQKRASHELPVSEAFCLLRSRQASLT